MHKKNTIYFDFVTNINEKLSKLGNLADQFQNVSDKRFLKTFSQSQNVSGNRFIKTFQVSVFSERFMNLKMFQVNVFSISKRFYICF